MNIKTNTTARVLVLVTIVTAASALAGDIELDWWAVDGGGDMWTTGGDIELSGSIGQADASATMTGGDIELTGGFWVVTWLSEPWPCPGDVDGDGDTDHSDLGGLLAAWGSRPGDPNWNPGADLDGNAEVGHSDLGILLADWGCGT